MNTVRFFCVDIKDFPGIRLSIGGLCFNFWWTPRNKKAEQPCVSLALKSGFGLKISVSPFCLLQALYVQKYNMTRNTATAGLKYALDY